MNPLDKEQILHKIVAASAFLFALSILPVAQFVLQNNYLEPQGGNSNQVAGVSTERETVRGNMPAQTREECEAAKAKETGEVDTWLAKTSNALENAYAKKVSASQDELAALTGTPEQIEQNQQEIDSRIQQETQTYLKKVSDFEKAAVSQKEAIESRVCPVE